MNSACIFDRQASRPAPGQAEKLLGRHAREIELILRCGRSSTPEPAAMQRLEELCRGPLDWDFILEFSRRHGLVAPVYLTLQRLDAAPTPAPLMGTLKKQVWERTKWNLHQAVELLKILKHFEARGIRAIPFKGPVLTATIYRDLRLRSSGDLDILVRQEDLPQARRQLLALGFSPYTEADGDEWDEIVDETKDLSFNRDDGIRVELHWRTLPRSLPFLPDCGIFWESVVTVPFLDSRVLQFAPQVLFVLLCVHHGINHFYESMHWVCDIDRFLGAYPGLDWEAVFGLAGRSDGARAVLLGCLLARMLLGTELPVAVAARLEKEPQVRRLAATVIRWRLKENREKIGLCARWLFYSRARSDWKSRLHLIQRLILTPKRVDRRFVRLPAGLDFLYVLVRPLRLLAGFLLNRNLK